MVPQPAPEALNTARPEQPGLFHTLYSAVEGRLWREVNINKQNQNPTQNRGLLDVWHPCDEGVMEKGRGGLFLGGGRFSPSWSIGEKKGVCGLWVWSRRIVLSVGLAVLYCIVLSVGLLHLKSDRKFRTIDNSLLVDFINKTQWGMPLAIYFQDQTIQGVTSV